MTFDPTHLTWAVLIGGLSAISLPLGSVVGLSWRPGKAMTAALTAFGGGALLAALAVEIVAPHVMALTHDVASRDAVVTDFVALIVGAVLGGILFLVLDNLVDTRGGFLRKRATAIAWFSEDRRKRSERLFETLGELELLRDLPPAAVRALVDGVTPVVFGRGDPLLREGEASEGMFILLGGQVSLSQGGAVIKEMGPGEVLGEMGLITHAPRTATATACGRVKALELRRVDYEAIREAHPELEQVLRTLAGERIQELGARSRSRLQETLNWMEQAEEALRAGTELPSMSQVRRAGGSHSGATLGIWLGILLDGIPESFVIGSTFLALLAARVGAGQPVELSALIPYTLIAGLFLSNFPEAMSSSVLMREQGWRAPKILFMWSTILLVTMVGAGVGYLAGGSLPHMLVAGMEGLAAGAMLTMIASTMLPEAVHLGDPDVAGLSTLAGFLAAVSFKLLE